ncbi:hypothetical protein GCM10009771_02020 [Nesterenkonia flava]
MLGFFGAVAMGVSACSAGHDVPQSPPSAYAVTASESAHVDPQDEGSYPGPDYVPSGVRTGPIGDRELVDSERFTENIPTERFTEANVAEGASMPECFAEWLETHVLWVEEGSRLSEARMAQYCPADEVVVECSDPSALAANAGHVPAGWPQNWTEGEPLPDPECHPDFIEMRAWDLFDEFHLCCEGLETSTVIRHPGMSEQEIYDRHWEASRARAEWEPW